MFATDDQPGKDPEFTSNVATVYSYPRYPKDGSGDHDNGNAKTRIAVGETMGQAVVGLLNSDSKSRKRVVS